MICLLALFLQEPVDDLIDRLRSDDASVREKATKDLIDRGEAVRAKIEELTKSSDGEISGRARVIIVALDERKVLRDALGEEPTFELHAKDEPLTEVLKRFNEKEKLGLEFKDVPADARVTIDAKSANAYELVELACRASDKTRFEPAALQVVGGDPGPVRCAFKGRWGVWLKSVERGKQEDPRLASATLVVFGKVAKDPYVIDLNYSELRTDSGEDLAGGDAPLSNGQSTMTLRGVRVTSRSEWFNEPDDDVKTLTLRGTVDFHYDVIDGVAKIDAPKEGSSAKDVVGSGTVSIGGATRTGDQMLLSVDFLSQDPRDLEPLNNRPVIPIRAYDPEGHSYDGTSSSVGSGIVRGAGFIGYTSSFQANFKIPADVKIARFEITYPKKTYTASVPFEFKDVPIK